MLTDALEVRVCLHVTRVQSVSALILCMLLTNVCVALRVIYFMGRIVWNYRWE